MTATDDVPIASWADRIGTLRKRGRVSAAALEAIPAEDIDVRRGRPPPLSGSRRPSEHSGSAWSSAVVRDGSMRVRRAFWRAFV